MNSDADVETVTEESVTCVAAKEDRLLNIMSDVALKEGIEEPWAIEWRGSSTCSDNVRSH